MTTVPQTKTKGKGKKLKEKEKQKERGNQDASIENNTGLILDVAEAEHLAENGMDTRQ